MPGWSVGEVYWGDCNTKSAWKTRMLNHLNYRSCRQLNMYYWDELIASPGMLDAVREIVAQWTPLAWQSQATVAPRIVATPTPCVGNGIDTIYIEVDSTNKRWVNYSGENLILSTYDTNPDVGMNNGNIYMQVSDDNLDNILDRQDGIVKFEPSITTNPPPGNSGYYKVYVAYAGGQSANRCDWEFRTGLGKVDYGMLNQALGTNNTWKLIGSFYIDDDWGSQSDASFKIRNRHQVNGAPGNWVGDTCKFVKSDNLPQPSNWQNFSPASTTDLYPNCSIQVSDTTGGLRSGSAQFAYSRDGGTVWSQWLGRYCIKSQYTTSGISGNGWYYRDIFNCNCSSGTFVVKSGDILHYDIYIGNSNTLGGIEIEFQGGTFLRDSGAKDQNGISCHPNSNLTAYAGQWYHREIPIPSTFAGKGIAVVEAAHETDVNSTSLFYLRNIFITNNKYVRLRIYGDEPISDFAFPVETVWTGSSGTFSGEILTITADPDFSFTSANGSTSYETITVTDAPFGQYSLTANKIKFRARDISENIGESPVYNVSIPNVAWTSTSTRTPTPTSAPGMELPRQSYGVSSTVAVPSWEAPNLVDNNTGTGWSSVGHSSASYTEWAYILFDKLYDVTEIWMWSTWNGQCFPVDFKIQYCTDAGVTWYDISGANYTNQPRPAGNSNTVKYITKTRARGIRIYTTKLSADEYNGYYMQLTELKAWGSDPNVPPTSTSTKTPTTPALTNTPTKTNTYNNFTPTKTFTNTPTKTNTLVPTATITPTVANTSIPTNTNKPYTVGDVNCDGSLTPGDALMSFQIYLKSYIPAGNEPCDVIKAADFNEDGNITPGDALCVFREYLRNPC